MKIVKDAQRKLVTPAQMQDGEIGAIKKWSIGDEYNGIIVQKYDNTIICLGVESDKSWTNASAIISPDCQIEILPPGTLLEI